MKVTRTMVFEVDEAIFSLCVLCTSELNLKWNYANKIYINTVKAAISGTG
jgi:hypothetical protein